MKKPLVNSQLGFVHLALPRGRCTIVWEVGGVFQCRSYQGPSSANQRASGVPWRIQVATVTYIQVARAMFTPVPGGLSAVIGFEDVT